MYPVSITPYPPFAQLPGIEKYRTTQRWAKHFEEMNSLKPSPFSLLQRVLTRMTLEKGGVDSTPQKAKRAYDVYLKLRNTAEKKSIPSFTEYNVRNIDRACDTFVSFFHHLSRLDSPSIRNFLEPVHPLLQGPQTNFNKAHEIKKWLDAQPNTEEIELQSADLEGLTDLPFEVLQFKADPTVIFKTAIQQPNFPLLEEVLRSVQESELQQTGKAVFLACLGSLGKPALVEVDKNNWQILETFSESPQAKPIVQKLFQEVKDPKQIALLVNYIAENDLRSVLKAIVQDPGCLEKIPVEGLRDALKAALKRTHHYIIKPILLSSRGHEVLEGLSGADSITLIIMAVICLSVEEVTQVGLNAILAKKACVLPYCVHSLQFRYLTEEERNPRLHTLLRQAASTTDPEKVFQLFINAPQDKQEILRTLILASKLLTQIPLDKLGQTLCTALDNDQSEAALLILNSRFWAELTPAEWEQFTVSKTHNMGLALKNAVAKDPDQIGVRIQIEPRLRELLEATKTI